jgi:hypothetical protein
MVVVVGCNLLSAWTSSFAVEWHRLTLPSHMRRDLIVQFLLAYIQPSIAKVQPTSAKTGLRSDCTAAIFGWIHDIQYGVSRRRRGCLGGFRLIWTVEVRGSWWLYKTLCCCLGSGSWQGADLHECSMQNIIPSDLFILTRTNTAQNIALG